jgi:predicted DNA binding CopG/RHH family protein
VTAKRVAGETTKTGASRGQRPPGRRELIVPLDAEDIAMARLQAHLRQTEAIHAPRRPAAPSVVRTTVRLPSKLLEQVRIRARRDGVNPSDVVELALERYFRSR